MIKQRRAFIKQVSLLTAMPMLMPMVDAIAAENKQKKQKILLRSGWQTINIGDIGHTFGLMELFKQYLPGIEVVLWSNLLDRGVDELLKKTYPTLTIINDKPEGSVERTAQLKAAYEECTILVHGSGPYITSPDALKSWWNETKKPFGVYGVSLNELTPELQELINHASFFYCRDTESLKYLKSLDLKCPVQEFGPDATFGIKVHNEAKAATYLQSVGLKKEEYICMIPRLRYTPNWKLKHKMPTDEDLWKDKVSEVFKETDAIKLRAIITTWVKKTGLKVLLCPEVTYQVELSKETLYDPLPEEIKKNVVWRNSFWLPDEAASVYAKSRALVCCEPHSPIIALADGIPSIHIKQPSDTRKGKMFIDIGLEEWYFLIDETPASQVAGALLKIHNDYPAALAKANKARAFLKKTQKANLEVIKNSFPKLYLNIQKG